MKGYHNTMPDEPVLIDGYGRPYYQTDNGKIMLIKEGGYVYSNE